MRVLFYPAFGEQAPLTDHFYRAHWYLRPFAARLSEVVLAHTLTDEALGLRPDYLDPHLAEQADGFATLSAVSDQAELDARVRGADIVLLWDARQAEAPALKGKKVVRIDHSAHQYAGSYYLKIAERFFPDLQAEYQRASEAVFARIAARFRGRIGYIFGTGPGLAHAADHDFSDGVSIACNSMVRNHALLERLQPPLIVVGDPIFHAGPSSYAAAFRTALIEAMDRYGSDLIVPMRDYHVYRAHLPARFAGRICAIPFVAADAPNLDLSQSLHVSTTGNVLTLFLLPLAATFCEEIRIFGCDGRPLDQNTYFWSHDKASQFNDEMGAIQRAHPAFFAIDYDEYYLKHCTTLEAWLAAAEAAGKRVSNHTQSYIPALLKRSVDGVGEPVREEPPAPVASIVMPAFNAAEYIDEAVRSVIAQDFADWELLIVEDGSTDATLKVAEGLARADGRVKVLRNPRKGVSSARNTGIEAARGRYVGFLDADDTMDSGSLSARVAALEGNGDLKLVHSTVRRIDETGAELGQSNGATEDIGFADMWRNAAHVNTLLVRADVMKAFRFDEGMTNGEDWLLLARILRTGARSRFVAEGSATWRVQANSTMTRAMERHERNLIGVIDWVYGAVSTAEAAPEFVEGLSAPSKSDIIAERADRLLVWSLLCNDAECVRTVLHDPAAQAWRERVAPATRRAIVVAAGVRRFRRRKADLGALPAKERQRIEATIAVTGLALSDEVLTSVIREVFALDALDPAKRRMLIIGNGPSARALVERGLHNLPDDVDTFGMGAAYRYFSQVNWWPTYYALADCKVVHSHREALTKLIHNPEVPTRRFYFARPLTESARFSEIPHSSTGDFCFKKAVDLGYREIYLVGIEGDYVEEIAECRPLSDDEFIDLGFAELNLPEAWRKMLIITRTPEHNPNYFFDDYQMKGDVYSLPQSKWHRNAWARMELFARNHACNVFNLSPTSKVDVFAKFPLSTIFTPTGDSNAAEGGEIVPLNRSRVNMQAARPWRELGRHAPVLSAAGAFVHDNSDVLACGETIEGWQPHRCKAVKGQAWFPLGGGDHLRRASSLIEAAGASVHGVRKVFSVQPGLIEFSGFVRSAGRQAMGVWIGEEGKGVTFDLATGEVGVAKSNVIFTVLEAELLGAVSERGDWWQFRIVCASPEPSDLLIQLNIRDGSKGPTRYIGDGRRAIDLWGLHVLADYRRFEQRSVG